MAEKAAKAQNQAKRTVRTPEARIKAIDEKIAKLQAEKEAILRPLKLKAVIEKAEGLGMSPEEIAEKLGIQE